jgi:hypothetical protein
MIIFTTPKLIRMKNQVNKLYLWTVLLSMLILPVLSTATDHYFNPSVALLLLTGKWFVFWAIGVRLFTAGLRQVIKPAFTAGQISHISAPEAHVIVKELGLANICMGLTGMLSLLIPGWLSAAAFIGGLYLGIAGINHLIKKPVSLNEIIATVSDIYIFLLMAGYLYYHFTAQ